MSTKLISLRHVPDEEAAAIRELLDAHNIRFYETPASRWGTSAAIIWLEDQQQQQEAQALLTAFQQDYTERQRTDYITRITTGQQPGFLDRLKAQPIQVIGLLLAAAIILWLSTFPFLLSA